MYITINKKNFLYFGSTLCVFLSYKFLSIAAFSEYGVQATYISWGLALVLSLFIYKDIIGFQKKYLYLSGFLCYVLISQIIICIYSMYTYEEYIIDMFICAGSYFLLLFTYFLLIGMENYGAEKFLCWFYYFSVVYMILQLINAGLKNKIGISFLTIDAVSKTRYMRMSVGSLYVVMMILIFWKIVSKESNWKNILIFVLGIVLELYVDQTRMTQLSLFFAFLFMWIFQRKKTEIKLVQVLITIVFIVAFVALGLHQEIINSFSTDPSVNKSASSTIARLNAIDYFKGYFYDAPWVGMGWVRPRSDYLTLIFAGPNRAAFFDDLGFLGQIFRQGILGGVIYLLFIARLIFIEVKLPNCSKFKSLVLGIVIYILVSAISLNCFDGQRILGTAFFIAITEIVYIRQKEISTC